MSATASGSAQINLSWTASTDAVGVQGYKLYRGGSYLTTVGSNSWSDTGLSGSTAYSYTVSAIDAAANESSQSGSAGATTGAGGTVTAFASNVYGDLTTSVTATGATSTMAYDLAGRLKSISAAGSTTSLLPDALGRIRSRTVGAVTDTYGYQGPSETIATIGGGTSTRASVLGADGSRIATKDGSTLGYLVPDLHGNVAAVMASGSGTLVNALRYDGYGQTLGSSYAAGSGQLANVDARYQGRLDLAPTGDPVYEFSAREYAPALGSFTSLDSVMGSALNPASMNRFLYAEANPTTLIDPTGHGADCSYQDKCDHDQWQDEFKRKQQYEQNKKEYEKAHPKPKPSGSPHGGGGGTPPKTTPNPIEVALGITFDEKSTAATGKTIEEMIEEARERSCSLSDMTVGSQKPCPLLNYRLNEDDWIQHSKVRATMTSGCFAVGLFGGVMCQSGGSGEGPGPKREGSSSRPPTGAGGLDEKAIKEMIAAATKVDRNFLTRAGRAIQKHGDRPGSPFERTRGTAQEMNERGLEAVEAILRDLTGTVTRRITKDRGAVVDVQTSSGRGGRWTEDLSEFAGFLENRRR